MQRAQQLETPFKQQNVLLSQLVTQITSEYESKWLISVPSKDRTIRCNFTYVKMEIIWWEIIWRVGRFKVESDWMVNKVKQKMCPLNAVLMKIKVLFDLP